MKKKKIILVIGPQASGTKLTASICKTFFGCAGEVSGGSFPPPDKDTSSLMIRYSAPAGCNSKFTKSGLVENKFFPSLNHDIAWVNLDDLLSRVRDLYNPHQIYLLCPIRDYTFTIKSLMAQGMTLDGSRDIHDMSLEFVMSSIKKCKNLEDVKFQWLSYEFLTYDTETCLKALSQEMEMPIILDDKTFKEKCDLIVPRNKYHLKPSGNYKAATHQL